MIFCKNKKKLCKNLNLIKLKFEELVLIKKDIIMKTLIKTKIAMLAVVAGLSFSCKKTDTVPADTTYDSTEVAVDTTTIDTANVVTDTTTTTTDTVTAPKP